MNRFMKHKFITAVFGIAASWMAARGVQAAPLVPTSLDSNDYIRVTVKEEIAEQFQLQYGVDGLKIESPVLDGEVVKLHAENMQQNVLGDFSFVAYLEEGNPLLKITDTNPDGYAVELEFLSTGEKVLLDFSIPVVVATPGAKMEVIKAGNIQDDFAHEPQEPIAVEEAMKLFGKQGVLEMKFSVEKTVYTAHFPDGGEDAPDAEGAASGCSLGAGSAAGAANLGFLPLALIALWYRRKR